MVSHSISTHDKGFTLVEILVTVAILLIIIGFGLFLSFDFYKNFAFHSEETTIVSMLQKARGQSMNNIDEMRHGVHFFDNGGKLTYRLFECQSACTVYSGSSSSDFDMVSSYNSSITFPSLPFDVIFDQLSGSCINCQTSNIDLHLVDNAKSYDITINSEGTIDW